jgi:hypothetical protein
MSSSSLFTVCGTTIGPQVKTTLCQTRLPRVSAREKQRLSEDLAPDQNTEHMSMHLLVAQRIVDRDRDALPKLGSAAPFRDALLKSAS